MERNNRACRRCNENLLHLAVACSKSLPSVSYWKGTWQLEKGRLKQGERERASHSDTFWQTLVTQATDGWMEEALIEELVFMRRGPQSSHILNEAPVKFLVWWLFHYISYQREGYFRMPGSVINNGINSKEHTQLGLSAFPPRATWKLVDSDKRIACTSSNGHLCRKIKH